MQQLTPHILLGKMFNISGREVPRVLKIWTLRLVYYLGYFLMWIVAIALFVGAYGLYYLPLLYVVYALFSMAGSFVYSFVIYKVKRSSLMEITLMLLLGSLLFSFFYRDVHTLFFLFFFLALGVFLPQIDILLIRETEDDFTPLENQRVVPLIETTEPLGGMLSGILVILLIGTIHTENFLFLIGAIFMMLLILFIVVQQIQERMYRLGEKKEHLSVTSILRGVEHIKAIPFMRGIALLLLLWTVTLNIIDIQYTRALDTVHDGKTAEHVLDQSPLQDILAERMGTFQILFSVLVIVMQLFFTGRIIGRLGIVRSFFPLPFVTMILVCGSILFPGMLFPVLSKASMEMLGGVQKTAYHSAYYSVAEHMREHIRELLEGILKPISLLLSTLLIFLVQTIAPLQQSHIWLSYLGILLFVAMVLVVMSMQKSFTMTAKKNLEMSKDFELTSNAIEILSQPGHHHAADILSKALLYRTYGPGLKMKILQALGRLQDPLSLPEILTCLKDDHLEVKIEACRALAQFQDLGKRLHTQVFSKYHIITVLSALFIKEDSKQLRAAIIKVLSNIQHHEIVHFLLDILQHNQDEEMIADSIYVIGLFGDINCYPYIAPYLSSSSPRIKANAVIALWQFPKYRLQLLIHLLSLLESKEKNTVLAGIYALGEIRALQEAQRLCQFLHHDDQEIVQYAAVALLKMDQDDAIAPLLSLLFDPDEQVAYKTYNMIREISTKTARLLKKILKIEGVASIHTFIHAHALESVPRERIEKDYLKQLLRYYVIMEEDREVMKIKQWLYSLETGTS
jgi:HEAT repeat protein